MLAGHRMRVGTYIFWLSLFICLPAHAQVNAKVLIDQRISMHLRRATFLQALSTLCVDDGIAIGFEPALNHKDEPFLNVNADRLKLKYVLDRIVHQQGGYRWEERDGVINIIPTKSQDLFVEKLLSTFVHRFDPPKVLGPFQIRDAILELPEVSNLFKDQDITGSHYGYFYHHPGIGAKVDLTTSNTDIRGLLNKIIRESDYKMWIVSRSGNNLDSLDMGF